MRTRAEFCLTALIAGSLGGFACGGGRGVDLPAVEIGHSAHFRYYARAADRVPATVLDLLTERPSDSFVQLDVVGPRAATVTTGPAAPGVTICPACDSSPADCTVLPPLGSATLTLNGTSQVALPAGTRASISLPAGP